METHDPGPRAFALGYYPTPLRGEELFAPSALANPNITRHPMPRTVFALALLAFASHVTASEPKPLEFKLTFDKAALDRPFTGRVFVVVRMTDAPPSGLNWFQPEPGLAKDVTDWKPGEPLVLDARSM